MPLRLATALLFLPSPVVAETLKLHCRAAPSFDIALTVEDTVCRLNEKTGQVEHADDSRRCVVSAREAITITADLIFRYSPPDGRPEIWGRCLEKMDG